MAGRRAFMMGFGDGHTLSVQQQHALGELGLDRLGQQWSYVRFQETVDVGQWVQDFRSAEITPSTPRAAAGEHNLRTPVTVFASAEESVGAIGRVDAGGSIGDIFIVDKWNAAGNVEVRVIANASDRRMPDSTGWSAALSSATRFRYALPGRVIEGNTANETIRGVSQVDVLTADVGKFGWVQQTGVGLCKIGSTLGTGTDHRLYLAANGDFITTPVQGEDVARALVPGVADVLVPAELHVVNNAMALGGPPPKRPVGAGAPAIR